MINERDDEIGLDSTKVLWVSKNGIDEDQLVLLKMTYGDNCKISLYDDTKNNLLVLEKDFDIITIPDLFNTIPIDDLKVLLYSSTPIVTFNEGKIYIMS